MKFNGTNSVCAYLENSQSQSIVHRRCTAAAAGQSCRGQSNRADSASPRCPAPNNQRPSIPCRTCKPRTCSARVPSTSGPDSPRVRSVRPCSRESSGSFRRRSLRGRCSWQSRIHHRAGCTPCPSTLSCTRIRRSDTALDLSTAPDRSLKKGELVKNDLTLN